MSKNDLSLTQVLVLLILSPFSMLWRGFVTMNLWGWFVASRFPVPPLSCCGAVGLGLVISLFANEFPKTAHDDVEDPDRQFIGRIMASFLLPLFYLGAGVVVHLIIAP